MFVINVKANVYKKRRKRNKTKNHTTCTIIIMKSGALDWKFIITWNFLQFSFYK